MPNSRFRAYPSKAHPSGQARIRLDGKQVYLGLWGSPASIARHQALREKCAAAKSVEPVTLTVDELCLRHMAHAGTYYRKNGQQTSEVHCIRAALRPLVKLFGPTLAAQFGPLRLQQVREEMIRAVQNARLSTSTLAASNRLSVGPLRTKR